MPIVGIQTQYDLDQHFEWHKKQREKFDDVIEKILDRSTTEISEKDRKTLEYLQDLKDKMEVDCYPLELEKNGKITMYVNHEGSCMSNIQYCPFCGIKFEVLPQQKFTGVSEK